MLLKLWSAKSSQKKIRELTECRDNNKDTNSAQISFQLSSTRTKDMWKVYFIHTLNIKKVHMWAFLNAYSVMECFMNCFFVVVFFGYPSPLSNISQYASKFNMESYE